MLVHHGGSENSEVAQSPDTEVEEDSEVAQRIDVLPITPSLQAFR
jgi:hypothetical protein